MIRVFLLLSLAAGSAVAEKEPGQMSGQALAMICIAEQIAVEEGESAFDEMFCHGYIQGIYDAYASELCPVAAQRKDLATDVLRLIQLYPELGSRAASVAVVAALNRSCASSD